MSVTLHGEDKPRAERGERAGGEGAAVDRPRRTSPRRTGSRGAVLARAPGSWRCPRRPQDAAQWPDPALPDVSAAPAAIISGAEQIQERRQRHAGARHGPEVRKHDRRPGAPRSAGLPNRARHLPSAKPRAVCGTRAARARREEKQGAARPCGHSRRGRAASLPLPKGHTDPAAPRQRGQADLTDQSIGRVYTGGLYGAPVVYGRGWITSWSHRSRGEGAIEPPSELGDIT